MFIRIILIFACLAAVAPAGIGFLSGITRGLTADLVSASGLALVRVLTIAVVEIGLFAALAYFQDVKRFHHVALAGLIAALLATMLDLVLGVIMRSLVSVTSASVPAFDIGSPIETAIRTGAVLFLYAGLGGLLGHFAAKARSRTPTAAW